MEHLHVLMAAVTAVILFVFGLDHFSREIERLSGERFRKRLASATRLPIVGVIIGALVTALIQSSSATSVITISLVNAGILSFRSSIGIIFGSNIGTTMTAQLVAFKLTAFAPLLIILGFVMSLVRSRFAIFGKAVFYFGFVFFTLNLISASLQPLNHDEFLVRFLTQPQNPLYAIGFGCLFTALVQSSSVTTGLAIIFAQQGLITLENAVPLIMGANIGTTATALIAVFNMDIAAKKTALCHLLFNVGGVVLFTPLLFAFGHRLADIDMDPAIALASIHLIFNVATTFVFLLILGPFARLIDMLLGEGKMEFERLPLPVFDAESAFTDIKAMLDTAQDGLLAFIQENYNVVTLSIEANYRGIIETAEKRIEYFRFVKREYLNFFTRVVASINNEEDIRTLMQTINQFDYLFQIEDSICDIFDTGQVMTENFIEPRSDILLMIRELSSQTLGLFDEIRRASSLAEHIDIRTRSKELQRHLDTVNKDLLALMSNPERRDAGALANFITYSQRLKDKLVNFYDTRLTAEGAPA